MARSRGLGDVYKRQVKAVAGDDCGCAARRDALNAMFPFQTGKDHYYTEKIKKNK
jgi:hypothetical protein